MVVENRGTVSQYDGQKMFLHIRTSSEEEIDDIEFFEITSLLSFDLMNENVMVRRKP